MGANDFLDSMGGRVVFQSEDGAVVIGLFIFELQVMLSGFVKNSLKGLLEERERVEACQEELCHASGFGFEIIVIRAEASETEKLGVGDAVEG